MLINTLTLSDHHIHRLTLSDHIHTPSIHPSLPVVNNLPFQSDVDRRSAVTVLLRHELN